MDLTVGGVVGVVVDCRMTLCYNKNVYDRRNIRAILMHATNKLLSVTQGGAHSLGTVGIIQLYPCSTVLDYLPGGRREGTECGRGAGGGCRAGGEADGEGKSSSGRQEEFQ